MLYVYLTTLIHGRKISNGATNCTSMWTENNIHAVLCALIQLFQMLTFGEGVEGRSLKSEGPTCEARRAKVGGGRNAVSSGLLAKPQPLLILMLFEPCKMCLKTTLV